MEGRGQHDFNLTQLSFHVQDQWLFEAILLTPGALLGFFMNIIVLYLGTKSPILGNFCFVINTVAVVNAIYCLASGITLLFYFTYRFLHLDTSLIQCTLVGNLSAYVSYFIIVFIPVIGAYRCVSLCVKMWKKYLSKENILLALCVLAVIPSVIVVGRITKMLSDMSVNNDTICGYRLVFLLKFSVEK
jgi:hypothetical protein